MKTVRWLTPLGCVMLLGSAILHSSGYIRLVHRIEAAGIQFPLAVDLGRIFRDLGGNRGPRF